MSDMSENYYLNEFVVRGVLESIEEDKYGNTIVSMGLKERRAEKHIRLTADPMVTYLKKFRRKDRVIAKGYIKAFRYFNDTTQKESYLMLLMLTDIQKESTELARRFARPMPFGHFYPEAVQRVFVAGRVEKVLQPYHGWGELTIGTRGGGTDPRPSHIVLRYYTRGALPFYDYQVGDMVATRLSIYAKDTISHSGNPIHLQSLTVEDIDFLVPPVRKTVPVEKFDIDAGLPGTDLVSRPVTSPSAEKEAPAEGIQEGKTEAAKEEAPARPEPPVEAKASDVDLFSNITFNDEDDDDI